MTETAIRQARFLDLLYDYDRANPGQVPGAVDLLGAQYNPEDEDIWRGILRELDYQGLIKLAETMGFDGTAVMITGSGREEVEERRARRIDLTQRNPAVRNAVVGYVYGHSPAPDLSPMLESHHYEGELLTKRDVDSALEYLLAKGLVKGIDVAEAVLIHIELTDRGIDCAERFGGRVGDFLDHEGGGRGNTTLTIHGNVSGSNLAWQNTGGITQTANVGVSGDDLVGLVAALKQALPVLGLDNADLPTLHAQLDLAEGELETGTPDAGLVKSVLNRVLTKIGQVGETQLGLLLTAWAKDLMEKAGLPLN